MNLYGIYLGGNQAQVTLVDVVEAESKEDAVIKSAYDAKGQATYAVSIEEYNWRAENTSSQEQKEILLNYIQEIKKAWQKKKK